MGNAPAIDWDQVGEAYSGPPAPQADTGLNEADFSGEPSPDEVGVVDTIINYAGDIATSVGTAVDTFTDSVSNTVGEYADVVVSVVKGGTEFALVSFNQISANHLYVNTKVKVLPGLDNQLWLAVDGLKARVSRHSPGIEDIELYKDVENEGYYWLKEEWETPEAYATFQASEGRDGILEPILSCLEDPAVEVTKTRRVVS